MKQIKSKRVRVPEKSVGVNKIKTIAVLLFLIAGVEFLISAGYYLYSVPQVQKTIGQAITPKEKGMTDLYFADSQDLPTEAEQNKDYSFKFTVANREGEDMNYPYVVYLNIDGLRHEVDSGKFFLGRDKSKTISETYQIPVAAKRVETVVLLTGKSQQIDFWSGN